VVTGGVCDQATAMSARRVGASRLRRSHHSQLRADRWGVSPARGRRLDRITPAQLRRYHLFLLEERRLAVGTVVTQICALRFFCRYVLKRRDVRDDLPYPKHRLRLPVVLPITTKVLWEAVRLAARKANIDKRVTPHTLRSVSA
jgi:site-specific recombinase XerD